MHSLMFLFCFFPFLLREGPSPFGSESHEQLLKSEVAVKHHPYVYWKKEQPLKWEHFKGRADSADPVHGAVTYAGLDLKTETIKPWNGEITFKAVAVFDQNLSWVKPSCKDAQLLAHEQLHFDIAELFARKLEKRLNSMKLGLRDKRKIKQLQQLYNKQQLELQEKYDNETLHGIRTEQQKQWRKSIDRQLLSHGKSSPTGAQHLTSLNK